MRLFKLTAQDASAVAVAALGLDADAVGLTSPEGLAASLRRTASARANCSAFNTDSAELLTLLRSMNSLKDGSAIVARMPTITTVIISSNSVKPADFCFSIRRPDDSSSSFAFR